VLYQGLRLSWCVDTSFGRYVIQGFVFLVTIQAIINIAVAVGLFPTKGIGLPFVSYGNSALLSSVAMLGIIWRIVYERDESYACG
jgi:cell division protein FtsW